MYKLLLCWRYLRTRFLAIICIASVMLGVATLIVVNGVMGGFSTKLHLICDGEGTPLAVAVGPGQEHETQQAIPLCQQPRIYDVGTGRLYELEFKLMGL